MLNFRLNYFIKFGLSEKHTKFEKIFLMVLTNQLIYLVNFKTMRKIFFKLCVLLKKSELYFRMFFHPKNLESDNNNPWFKLWDIAFTFLVLWVKIHSKFASAWNLSIWQKPAHFLPAQMAVLSSFFEVFIVLGMYV